MSLSIGFVHTRPFAGVDDFTINNKIQRQIESVIPLIQLYVCVYMASIVLA